MSLQIQQHHYKKICIKLDKKLHKILCYQMITLFMDLLIQIKLVFVLIMETMSMSPGSQNRVIWKPQMYYRNHVRVGLPPGLIRIPLMGETVEYKIVSILSFTLLLWTAAGDAGYSRCVLWALFFF